MNCRLLWQRIKMGKLVEGDGCKRRDGSFALILSGETTEISGNDTGARGEEDSKREVVKRVAEIVGLEFNYTGEMELFTVEDGRPEVGVGHHSLEEVVLLWNFRGGCWVYPRAEMENMDVWGISKD